jgi:hypothetical protein
MIGVVQVTINPMWGNSAYAPAALFTGGSLERAVVWLELAGGLCALHTVAVTKDVTITVHLSVSASVTGFQLCKVHVFNSASSVCAFIRLVVSFSISLLS